MVFNNLQNLIIFPFVPYQLPPLLTYHMHFIFKIWFQFWILIHLCLCWAKFIFFVIYLFLFIFFLSYCPICKQKINKVVFSSRNLNDFCLWNRGGILKLFIHNCILCLMLNLLIILMRMCPLQSYIKIVGHVIDLTST